MNDNESSSVYDESSSLATVDSSQYEEEPQTVTESEGADSIEYNDLSSVCESLSDDSDGLLTVAESTVDSSSSCLSNDEYLKGIYENSATSVIFEFVILLLLVITIFSRFLINLIM